MTHTALDGALLHPLPATADLRPEGEGAKRAVGDMPKKCPCEDLRRWFFRDILRARAR